MSDHGDSPTCVSAEPHGPTSDSPRAIADLAAHYFGCIKISERAHFLDRNLNSQLWNHELDVQLDKLLYQEEPDMHADINIEANNRVDEKIKGLASKIETQYKRTDVLRKALSEVKCLVCTAPKNPSENPPCNLVNVAGHSHKEWKDSVSYKDGIKIIHEWRQRKNENENTTNGNDGLKHLASDSEDMPTGRKQVRDIIKKYHTNVDYEFEEDDTYELERDTNGYIIQWEVLGSSSTTCSKDQELSRKGDSKDRPYSIGQHPSFYKTSSAPEKILETGERECYGLSLQRCIP
ncbi:hypothetical protein CSUB01_09159 [Colletotrichum sublineola]|uniref:Uncharacterized protein n=1 Tax=Colletotrichum sublineola TaxID=1173701 RepID=A0A066XTK2_COLSU|nr:hypothetical protein CSUB01_09159 [Colletotrichum sublineola]